MTLQAPGMLNPLQAKANRSVAPGRLAPLDSLRGIAILAVLFGHILAALPLPADIQQAMVGLGRFGVTLFFLLSGYLIFRTVRTQSTGAFILRRVFKIVPAYWVNIALIFVIDRLTDAGPHFSSSSYLASILMISDVTGTGAVSGVFWTLLIEIKFYVFIALQHALLRDRGSHAIMGALVAFGVGFCLLRGHGSLTLAYFPVFYLGIEVSLAESEAWRPPAMIRLVGVSMLLAASLLVCLDQMAVVAALSLPVSAAMLTLALNKDLSHPITSFFGLTSYSNYLYHSLIAGALLALLGTGHSPLTTALEVGLTVLAATAAASLSFLLVESPMVRFGRGLTKRLGAPKSSLKSGV